MKVTAMVPIKLNNERLPGKNIKLLGNKPLISYMLSTLDNIKQIDDIYVYCSDERIKEYLVGRVKFLKRPKKFDSKTTNFTQIFESFYSNVISDIYLVAHATAPFIRKSTIIECVDKVKNENFDSAFTATKIQDFLWKDDGEALNFNPSNIPRSQDLPVIYRETSGVYVIEKTLFDSYKARVGNNPYIKEVGLKESVDINCDQDFKFAEILLDYKGANL